MTEQDRQWAIGRIRAKRGFWIHFSVYLAVNALLVVIWAATGTGYFWAIWPILGWGIGIIAHGASVFFGPREISEERIDRELQSRVESSTGSQAGQR